MHDPHSKQAMGLHYSVHATGADHCSGIPTIKVTGNPFTYAKSSDDIDVSVTDIISKGMSVEAGGEKIFDEMLNVASGKKTFSEILRITQSTIRVFGPSV
jgi:altronate dehydratase large subunit